MKLSRTFPPPRSLCSLALAKHFHFVTLLVAAFGASCKQEFCSRKACICLVDLLALVRTNYLLWVPCLPLACGCSFGGWAPSGGALRIGCGALPTLPRLVELLLLRPQQIHNLSLPRGFRFSPVGVFDRSHMERKARWACGPSGWRSCSPEFPQHSLQRPFHSVTYMSAGLRDE